MTFPDETTTTTKHDEYSEQSASVNLVRSKQHPPPQSNIPNMLNRKVSLFLVRWKQKKCRAAYPCWSVHTLLGKSNSSLSPQTQQQITSTKADWVMGTMRYALKLNANLHIGDFEASNLIQKKFVLKYVKIGQHFNLVTCFKWDVILNVSTILNWRIFVLQSFKSLIKILSNKKISILFFVKDAKIFLYNFLSVRKKWGNTKDETDNG